ncbi:Tn3 family transposase [Nonomuraea longispora]|uniref:Tn3 family transposase n=1 Tax=Nonomuraea longispora TaxID=1848320 RepID=UPI001404D817|nr:Tn3 family transposase [Nonomuraea longispora]
MAECWRDLLRMAGSPKYGQATASLIAQQGTIARPHLERQTEQAWCLTLPANSVVAWTTEYYSRAVLELRSQGREVSNEILSHISLFGCRSRCPV